MGKLLGDSDGGWDVDPPVDASAAASPGCEGFASEAEEAIAPKSLRVHSTRRQGHEGMEQGQGERGENR